MSTHQELLFEELKINKLPTLPHVLSEILDACQSEAASFKNLSLIISKDAVMASKIVALANSAAYFQRQKVNTIDKAMLLIGTERIKTIAITVAIQQFFSEFSPERNNYLKSFWARSLSCAMMAQNLATLTSYPHPELAYLTGLLHNVGDLVLRINFPNEYMRLDQTTDLDDNGIVASESALLSTNHCEVGAWLLTRWGLGDFASAAARYHHEPLTMLLDAHPLVKIIHVSSQLGATSNQIPEAGLNAAEKLFALTQSLTREIATRIWRDVITFANSLQIELPSEASDVERVRQKDERKHIALAEHIRNISLLGTTRDHLAGAGTIAEFCNAMDESAYMLFGYSGAKLFFLDETRNCLKYLDNRNVDQNVPSEDAITLEISLQNDRSLLAESVLQGKTISSPEWTAAKGRLTVVDQHVMQLLKTTYMLCVPLIPLNTALYSKLANASAGSVDQARSFPDNEQNVLSLNPGLLVFGSSRPPDLSGQAQKILRLFCDNVGRQFRRLQEAVVNGSSHRMLEEQQLKLRQVVHETANPLTIVRNYLDILADKLDPHCGASQELTIIREEIDRVGQLLVSLNDAGKPDDPSEGVDINQEISDLVGLFNASLFLTHGIQCQLEMDKNLTRQRLPRHKIKQILLNLVRNAVEAMADGGKLVIHSSQSVNVNGRRYIAIGVSDSGPGLSESALQSLFKPCTSSKGQGHAGLGLSISKNLVDELKGSISGRNTGQGAYFQVLLPARASGDASDKNTGECHQGGVNG